MDILSLFKKKKPPLKRLYIPEEKIEKYYELLDRFRAGHARIDKYRLWRFIENIFPETKGKASELGGGSITAPYIEYESSNDPASKLHIIEQGYRPDDKLDTSKPPAGRSAVPSVSPDTQAICSAIKSLNPDEKEGGK